MRPEEAATARAYPAPSLVPKGYKQTEVGVIPEDWDHAHLPDVAWYQEGPGVRNHQFTTVGVKLFNGTNIENGQINLEATKRFISEREAYGIYSHFLADDGDIVIACSGISVSRFDEKVAVLSRSHLPLCMNTSTMRFKVREAKASKEYFRHFLRSQGFKDQISGKATGSAQLNFGPAHVNVVRISLPPTLAEQQAIAEALSDADTLIGGLESLIAKKRAIKQGAMQELLTGKRRLPGFEGEWQVKRIGDLLTIRHGKSQHGVESVQGAYPILATGGQIGWSIRPLYSKPSVLIGRKGTIDRPQYMDRPFWTVDTLFYSEVYDPNSAKFLFYRLSIINWLQHNEASGVPSLNARTIEAIEISAPDALEQTAIAAILSDMDDDITALEGKLTKARQVKKGMMQELLTGRIRLV